MLHSPPSISDEVEKRSLLNPSHKMYKPTRFRTVLSDNQVNILKRCYSANPRPNAQMKEKLIDLTGLSLRVIRVWFQNKRCKDKKMSIVTVKGKHIEQAREEEVGTFYAGETFTFLFSCRIFEGIKFGIKMLNWNYQGFEKD